MTQDEMKYLAESGGAGALFFKLLQEPYISDDTEGDMAFSAGDDAYERCLPHIQSVWEAIEMGCPDMPTFERDSNVEEMFAAIFRAAFELGWKAAKP